MGLQGTPDLFQMVFKIIPVSAFIYSILSFLIQISYLEFSRESLYDPHIMMKYSF